MGVDIGKRNCVVCIMDSDGSIIEETKYNNTLDQAESFASYIKKKHGGSDNDEQYRIIMHASRAAGRSWFTSH
jgi:hypothetical protein